MVELVRSEGLRGSAEGVECVACKYVPSLWAYDALRLLLTQLLEDLAILPGIQRVTRSQISGVWRHAIELEPLWIIVVGVVVLRMQIVSRSLQLDRLLNHIKQSRQLPEEGEINNDFCWQFPIRLINDELHSFPNAPIE